MVVKFGPSRFLWAVWPELLLHDWCYINQDPLTVQKHTTSAGDVNLDNKIDWTDVAPMNIYRNGKLISYLSHERVWRRCNLREQTCELSIGQD